MSFSFTKLFSSITESTVWYEPDSTRLVWITMLAMADRQGRVWGSVPGLAGRARVPLDAARVALICFLSPDPDSRTKDDEGRRIEEIDGGWRLLNYRKYRELRDEEARKAYQREWVRDKRKSRPKSRQEISNVDQSRPESTYAEAESEKTQIGQTPSAFDRFWRVYPKKVKRKSASEIWARKRLDERAENLIADITLRLESDRRWLEGYVPDPTTYLTQERWNDELQPQKGSGDSGWR